MRVGRTAKVSSSATTPDSPCVSLLQNSSTWHPRALATPRPVTTTLRVVPIITASPRVLGRRRGARSSREQVESHGGRDPYTLRKGAVPRRGACEMFARMALRGRDVRCRSRRYVRGPDAVALPPGRRQDGEARLGSLTALVGAGYFFVWTAF